MCASHLLRIVDNRAAKRNNKPRSNYLARYGRHGGHLPFPLFLATANPSKPQCRRASLAPVVCLAESNGRRGWETDYQRKIMNF
jgi:hypothetical protein